MNISIIYSFRVEVPASGHIWKGIRRFAGPIFMFAFFLFTVNSLEAAHTIPVHGKNSADIKWTLAYRSLERAIEKAITGKPI